MASKQTFWSNKVNLGIAGGVGIFLIVYFLALPGVLAGSYKDKAVTAQNEVSEKENILQEAYKRPAFTKVDSKPADDKADLAATRKALDEAKAKLAESKKDLTGFVSLPLMSVNSKYRAAQTAAQDTKEWVSKSERYYREGTADLDYFEKLNELHLKFENTGQTLKTIGPTESTTSIAQKLETAANELQAAVDAEKRLQPTASLKKAQEEDIRIGEKYVSLFRQAAAAIRAGDDGQLESVSGQLDALDLESSNASNQAILDYGRDSTINKLGQELDVLDLRLEEEFKAI